MRIKLDDLTENMAIKDTCDKIQMVLITVVTFTSKNCMTECQVDASDQNKCLREIASQQQLNTSLHATISGTRNSEHSRLEQKVASMLIAQMWALVKTDALMTYQTVSQMCHQHAYLICLSCSRKADVHHVGTCKNSCKILDSNGQGLVTAWARPTEQG